MQTISFILTDEQKDFIEAVVTSGRYDSEAEVLQAAFSRWQRWESVQQDKLRAVNAAIEVGIASGIAEGTMDEIFERVIANAGLPRQAA